MQSRERVGLDLPPFGGYPQQQRLERQLGAASDGRLGSWNDVADFVRVDRNFTGQHSTLTVDVPVYARLTRIEGALVEAEVSLRLAQEDVRVTVQGEGFLAEDPATPSGIMRFLAREPISAEQTFQLIVRGETVQRGRVAELAVEPAEIDVYEPMGAIMWPGLRGIGDDPWTLDLALVHDIELRAVLERNVRELAVAQREGLHTCAIILAGALGEGILYDALVHRKPRAMAASCAPKAKKGGPKDLEAGQWTFFEYIQVAAELRLLSSSKTKMMHDVLRDFRNMIHPKVQVEKALTPDEAEMKASVAWLEAVARDIREAP